VSGLASGTVGSVSTITNGSQVYVVSQSSSGGNGGSSGGSSTGSVFIDPVNLPGPVKGKRLTWIQKR
jgi:hypothetical protein